MKDYKNYNNIQYAELAEKEDFSFETYMMALEVNGDYYDLGRLVIDYFKCPEHGWYYDPHYFFDKETIERSVKTVREEKPDAKDGKIIIIVPCLNGAMNFCVGKYNIGKTGFNYKVDIDKHLYEQAIQIIGDVEVKRLNNEN